MYSIRRRATRNLEDKIAAKVALGRGSRPQTVRLIGMKHMQRGTVGVRIDGHGPQPHLAAGANHPQRDLAAVRNQDFLYGPSQAAILPQAAIACGRTVAIQK